ncbi:hypothetical protein GCM10009799_38560 [Nocardiopsis rhodophaea]|uniref:Mercury ion transport protein n=1 Tax=Nocardiopsis rhodophaea TaxID=280238 RepID=A0ABP5ETC0_9ACTN
MHLTRPNRDFVSVPRHKSASPNGKLPVGRIGVAGGLVGILCCVGPTVLALLGVVSAGTAYVWANDLYDGYAWWFRLAGLAVIGVLVWRSLRRRGQCSVTGVRGVRWRLLAVAGVAVATYGGLYALTTWLGTFA